MEKPKTTSPNEPPMEREITAEFASRFKNKYTLDWMLATIMHKSYFRDKCWLMYCPKVTTISQEIYNEIEARGFGITWHTKKSAQFDGYYLITWGAN